MVRVIPAAASAVAAAPAVRSMSTDSYFQSPTAATFGELYTVASLPFTSAKRTRQFHEAASMLPHSPTMRPLGR